MSSDDAQIAVQAAMQTAEMLGEDMAIMSDLSILPIKEADGIVLEIIRCPYYLKKQ